MVGFDYEDAVADVPGAGVGGDVDAGELFPAGEEAVVLVGAVDLGVVEVVFEDFPDALGGFAGAPAEFGPVGNGVGGLMIGAGAVYAVGPVSVVSVGVALVVFVFLIHPFSTR